MSNITSNNKFDYSFGLSFKLKWFNDEQHFLGQHFVYKEFKKMNLSEQKKSNCFHERKKNNISFISIRNNFPLFFPTNYFSQVNR